ncbi:MAG: DUF4011 domain-containing protein [Cytophagales bacterium]|nr:DUF4011 domain-containing protein [Cytophagales bacterium]
MQKLLQAYARRLTNLSGRNRSLLLLRLSVIQDIDLTEFDQELTGGTFDIISQLIARKKSIPLCRWLDSRDKQINELSKRLKTIQRRDKFIYEERGARDLYVGWPFAKGRFLDGTLVRCPLLFFPVELSINKKNQWELNNHKELTISFNKSFLLAFSHFNKVALREEFIDHTFEDFSVDSRIFRTLLYELLKPFEINFNQDLFIDKIEPFKNFRKDEFEKKHQAGQIKLFPEAILGIFPLAGSYLMPDYAELIENNDFKDIEEFFLSKLLPDDANMYNANPAIGGANDTNKDQPPVPSAQHYLSKVKEEKTVTAFEMDASQENALKAVKHGNSIVVHGPPGTGKSQLICNLICDYIAKGKNVLLVCQKRAALDVAFRRMKTKGFENFIALVHDFKNDRKRIYEKINTQIDKLDEYRNINNSLDAILLEREFLHTSRRIDQITEELEEFKHALFDESECGISIKELYLNSSMEEPSVNLKEEYKNFNFREITGFVQKLRNYVAYAERFEEEGYPLKERISFKDHSVSDLQEILQLLKVIPQYQQKIFEKTTSIIGNKLMLEECQWVISRKEVFPQLFNILQTDKLYDRFVYLLDQPTNQQWFDQQAGLMLGCYSKEGIEISVPTKNLGKFQKTVQKISQARKSLRKWLKWKLFSKDKILITRVLVANGLRVTRKDLKILEARLDNRMNLEHNITTLLETPWINDIPESCSYDEISGWIDQLKKGLQAKELFSSLRSFKDHINFKDLSYREFKKQIEQLYKEIATVPEKLGEWQRYLTTNQINRVLTDKKYLESVASAIKNDFDSLTEYDKIKDSFKPYERSVVNKLLNKADKVNEDTVLKLFYNSLSLAWIEPIELKYPILRAVSSQKIAQLEKELQSCIKEKFEVCNNEIVLLKAREKVYYDLQYNRLNNMVTYRDLKHQVTKKRKIWPIRKLISNFSVELFNLIPCWMASPEAVSAIFPMMELFDLVIFDEASQCFAEKGIPAMYRGRQVVIAGDEMQLSPSDLYQVRWEEEEDEDMPELEIDSLLDLGAISLPNFKLLSHYRSKSLDLIDFSNKHFYEQRLQLLPDFNLINKHQPAINYLKVDGTWQDNTNVEEAKKVVELVEQLLKESKNLNPKSQIPNPKSEIGIITFNFKQQHLILDLLEEASVEKNFVIPKSLLVKNIENVQGDEKDIIIFSIGYAPDPKGRLIMHFGSLNAPKGENRLNVAVTRAKERVIIVSSILPQQLKVEDSKHQGPKLLKAYLQYARDVSDGKYKPTPVRKDDFNTSWFLKNKLININKDAGQEARYREQKTKEEAKNHQFIEELPFADITIKDKKDYKALILTDDTLYHQSVSVKDAHAYVPMNMINKNWKYVRVYSREFWKNQKEVANMLFRL